MKRDWTDMERQQLDELVAAVKEAIRNGQPLPHRIRLGNEANLLALIVDALGYEATITQLTFRRKG